MSTQITCPSCGQTLTVSDAAPAQLICPRCLAKLINPSAMTGGPARAVLPIETQTNRDMLAAKIGLAGLAILLGMGVFIVFARSGIRGFADPAMHVLMLPLIGALIWIGVRRAIPRSDAAAEPATESFETLAAREAAAYRAGLPILDYQSGRDLPRVSIGAMIGGFFASIGVCAAGFFTLGYTYSAVPKNAHGLVVLALAGAIIGYATFAATIGHRRPSWRGFGRGATIGLTLGMLALGPCAFCYAVV